MAAPPIITCQFTAKESAATHVLLSALIEHGADSLREHGTLESITRHRDELERQLKKGGCVLTDEGWHFPT